MHNIYDTRRDEVASDEADHSATAPAPLPTAILIEAIARTLCVTATYNRQVMVLAPHIVFSRHGDLFIDAVTVERDGNPPREIKLGTFKLAGLSALSLTNRSFAINPLYDAGDFKYAESVFAVQG